MQTETSLAGLGVAESTIARFARRHRVRSLAVFGSAARRSMTAASDIDIVMELEPDARVGLFEHSEMTEELSQLFGRKVDLVTWAGLRPRARPNVEREAVVLYGDLPLSGAGAHTGPTTSEESVPIRRDEQLLDDILAAARAGRDFLAGRTRADLDRDDLLRRAVIQTVTQVGEAAARLSDEARAALPDVGWARAIGMRNQLVHGYWDIDNDILWATVSQDFPPLIDRLEG